MDDFEDELTDNTKEITGLPIFAYDPENIKPQDDFMLELNKKLEVISESDYKTPKEPIPKKSFFEKFDEELKKPIVSDTEHNGNLIIGNLFDIVNSALSDLSLLHSPNFSGHSQDDRSTKVRIRHFLRGKRGLRSGTEWYAIRIGQSLDGLVKYAKYDRNFFGEDNINLKLAQQHYGLLKKQIEETKDQYRKAELLHGMITACLILFAKQQEVIEPIYVTPMVSAGSGSSSSDEFIDEFSDAS